MYTYINISMQDQAFKHTPRYHIHVWVYGQGVSCVHNVSRRVPGVHAPARHQHVCGGFSSHCLLASHGLHVILFIPIHEMVK